MRPTLPTPLLAGLSALIFTLLLTLCPTFARAQSLPETQRLMKQGQMAQALDKVDIYLSKKPKDAQGRFLRGLILTDLGRQSDAIAVFTKLTEDFPELPEPYNNLAVLYAQQKQYDKARSSLEMAIRTHPSYSIAHENLGDVYAKLASQAYNKALQLDSANSKTQTKLSLIKELISASSNLPVKPEPAAKPEVTEPIRIAAAEPANGIPTAKVVTKTPEPENIKKQPTANAPATTPPADKSSASANNEPEIIKALQSWANAWSRKDVKGYISHYAADFQTPKGMSRKAWEAQRAQRIDKPGKIAVTLEEIKITIDGDKARAHFRQNYTSSTLKSSTSKIIDFVKSGGKWLIRQEHVG